MTKLNLPPTSQLYYLLHMVCSSQFISKICGYISVDHKENMHFSYGYINCNIFGCLFHFIDFFSFALNTLFMKLHLKILENKKSKLSDALSGWQSIGLFLNFLHVLLKCVPLIPSRHPEKDFPPLLFDFSFLLSTVTLKIFLNVKIRYKKLIKWVTG